MSYREQDPKEGIAISPDTDGAEKGMGDFSTNFAKAYRSKAATTGYGESPAGIAGSAMLMSGEPTTMAAGAALKVVSSIADKRRREAQARADAENDRRTKLMTAMSNLGQGVGSVGMA